MKLLLLISVVFIFFGSVSAQTYKWKCLENDTVEISMPNHSGTVSWQSSVDSINWVVINGASTNPFTAVIINSPTNKWYFRGMYTDGTCITYSYPVRINIAASPLNVNVGDFFHGGIVFHADGNGFGLIASPADQSASVQWGDNTTFCDALSDNRGDSNTVKIVAANPGIQNAAKLCDTLSLNNHSDWYLPSRNELNYLYTNQVHCGTFPADDYWSSTEANAPNAYYRRFSENFVDYYSKSFPLGCRCTRRYYLVEPHALVTINASLNPDSGIPLISQQPQSDDICDGQTAEISVEAQDAFFQWQKNGSDITGETSSSLVIPAFSSSDAGTYRCKVFRCANMVYSNNAVLNVLALPQLTVSNDTAICPGSSVQLDASGAVMYAWSPSGSISNPSIPNPIATPTQTTNFTVTATASSGCSDTASVTIFVQKPFEDEEICLVTVDSITGKNKIIWVKTSNVGTAAFNVYREVATNIYNWIGTAAYSDPSDFIDASSSPEIHNYKYKISVTDTCGNESQKSNYHQTINLTISQGVPSTTVVLQWNAYAVQTGLYEPSEYLIYRGTSPANMSLLATVPGSVLSYNDLNVSSLYYYKIVIERNCGIMVRSGSNVQDNSSIVGVEEHYSSSEIAIYPNPMLTSATVTIPNLKSEIRNPKSETGTNSDFVLRISDLTGKVVRTIPLARHPELVSGSTPAQFTIERGDLKPGVYFVELKADRVYRGKLVVE